HSVVNWFGATNQATEIIVIISLSKAMFTTEHRLLNSILYSYDGQIFLELFDFILNTSSINDLYA
ncbi:hypothetical protein O3G_MSEX004930, partial [Manduca sexta]